MISTPASGRSETMAVAMSGVFCSSHSTRELIFYSADVEKSGWPLVLGGFQYLFLGQKKGCFYGVELSVVVKHYILPKEQSCSP